MVNDFDNILNYTDDNFIDESEILPEFTCNITILNKLAYIKRCLRNLVLNTEEKHTKIDAIQLQDEIDKVVVMYSLSCVDNYLFG